jgi:hypothetical protein
MQCHSTRLASCLVTLGVLAGWGAPLAEDRQERNTIKVDPEILAAYVGQYELFPKRVLTLRRYKDRLTVQITGQPPVVVFAESDTKFFWKIVDAQFTIQKDQEGRVTGLLFEQGALKLKAKKISNEPPAEEEFRVPDETFESPRLAALAKEWKSGNKAALQEFWTRRRCSDRWPATHANPG